MSLRILGLFVYITLLETVGTYLAIFLLFQDEAVSYGLWAASFVHLLKMSVCITHHRILGLEAIFQETSKYAKEEIGKNRIKHRTLYLSFGGRKNWSNKKRQSCRLLGFL